MHRWQLFEAQRPLKKAANFSIVRFNVQNFFLSIGQTAELYRFSQLWHLLNLFDQQILANVNKNENRLRISLIKIVATLKCTNIKMSFSKVTNSKMFSNVQSLGRKISTSNLSRLNDVFIVSCARTPLGSFQG